MALNKSNGKDGTLLAFLLVLSIFSVRIAHAQAADEEHNYLVFQDDFEDGDIEDWVVNVPPDASPWSKAVVETDDGNYVLSERGHVWADAGDDSWANYTFEVKVKLLTSGGPQINFRMTRSRYFLGVHRGGLILNKEHPVNVHITLRRKEVSFDLDKWYTFRIVCIGNSIEVYVDGALILDYVDETDPLLSGRIGLEGAPDQHIHFDDVKVYTTHRLHVTHLIREAQDEIDEARMLGAETGQAEGKLAEAQAAFAEEDLSSAESLAEETIKLAKHSSVGHISVGELLKYSAEYDLHTVEISGTIRDIRYEEGVYSFAVDDGTGVISATFDGTLGEIKTDDKVKVTGIFDASTTTVAAESLEREGAPTEGFYTFLIFKDDFEDGDYSDWRINIDPEIEGSSLSVEREDDNYVLSGEGHVMCKAGDAEWTDYIFEFKIKLVKGMVFINFRFTQKPEAPDRYTLRLLSSHMALLKGEKYTGERHFTELKKTSVELDPDTWYDLKIICLGDNIKIYMDDNLKLDYTDEDYPFLSGMIGFEPVPYEGDKPSHALFDDVKVSKMATTGDISDLIAYAQSEIDKAREINADVSSAQLKLEQAKQALAQEDYKMVQYLVDETVWLAKRSSVGQISIKDLEALATKVSGHTVTLTGTVENLEARYGVGYEFELDDGTSKIHISHQGAMADIGEEYEVKVTGVFDSPTRAVTTSMIEKISTPTTQPRAAAGPTGITWSIELIATLISIGGAGVGAIGWIARTRSTSRRKKVLFKRLMDEVDDIYSRFKMNARRCETELHRLKGEALDEFKEGMIDEDKLNILNKRVDDYMREVREEIERNNARAPE